MSSFESYNALRDQLVGTLARLEAVHADVGIAARAHALAQSRARLSEEVFRLMVVGEFKRGKSTFINALLGRNLLPAKVAPCTAVITEVKYAAEPRAVLHPLDSSAAPITIPIERIRDYVVIDDGVDEDDLAARPPKWAKLEVYYPLELCKNNVVVTDSPGLNEHHARTDVALNYLPRADAMIMVLSCDQALSHSELQFIEQNLGDRDLSNVFFLWNRFDAVADSPDDLRDIQARSNRYLGSRVRADRQVFYVSSRDALKGRMQGDVAALERSRLPKFEAALIDFLVTDRGRIKVLAPLQSAEAALRDCALQLPRMEAVLTQPLAELRARYEAIQPRIAELETRRERVQRMLDRRQAALQREIAALMQTFSAELEEKLRTSAAQVPATWWDGVVSKQRTHKKIIEWLEGEITKELKHFETTQLVPLVQQHIEELVADLDDQLRTFLSQIEGIRTDFLGSFTAGVGGSDDDPHPLNRVLSAAGAFLLVGTGGLAGLAIEGAVGGLQGILKGLAYQVTALVAVVVLGALIPPLGAVILPMAIAASVGTAVVRAVIGGKSAVEKIRERAVNDVLVALRKALPEVQQTVDAKVGEKLGEFGDGVRGGMEVLAAQVRQEVEAVWREKQAGEQAVAESQARFARARQTLAVLSAELDALRAQITLA